MASAFTRAAARGARPPRAVVFALWNGEEKGDRSARSTTSRIPQPARRVVANINLDMVGRDEEIPDPDDPRYRGFAKTRASRQHERRAPARLLAMRPILPRAPGCANETIHLTIKEDYDRDSQNLVRRSDNWPFLRARHSRGVSDDRAPPGLPHAGRRYRSD